MANSGLPTSKLRNSPDHSNAVSARLPNYGLAFTMKYSPHHGIILKGPRLSIKPKSRTAGN